MIIYHKKLVKNKQYFYIADFIQSRSQPDNVFTTSIHQSGTKCYATLQQYSRVLRSCHEKLQTWTQVAGLQRC